MTLHVTLVLLSLALAPGCAAEGSADRSPPATQPAAQLATGAATGPAVAPKRVVEPVQVRAEGRNRIRTFDLRPGDAFQTERGGVITLRAIDDDQITLSRKSAWTLPAEPAEHSIGNSEYIKIIAVDRDASSLRLELRTVTRKRAWEALSF